MDLMDRGLPDYKEVLKEIEELKARLPILEKLAADLKPVGNGTIKTQFVDGPGYENRKLTNHLGEVIFVRTVHVANPVSWAGNKVPTYHIRKSVNGKVVFKAELPKDRPQFSCALTHNLGDIKKMHSKGKFFK
jgi:hypothetical protein